MSKSKAIARPERLRPPEPLTSPPPLALAPQQRVEPRREIAKQTQTRLQKVAADEQVQTAVMDAKARLTARGERVVAELAEFNHACFEAFAVSVSDRVDAIQSERAHRYVDYHTEHLVAMTSRHLHGLQEFGATAIAQEVQRATYHDWEEKSRWQRFFGK
jgi:hypothetical protein